MNRPSNLRLSVSPVRIRPTSCVTPRFSSLLEPSSGAALSSPHLLRGGHGCQHQHNQVHAGQFPKIFRCSKCSSMAGWWQKGYHAVLKVGQKAGCCVDEYQKCLPLIQLHPQTPHDAYKVCASPTSVPAVFINQALEGGSGACMWVVMLLVYVLAGGTGTRANTAQKRGHLDK